jgi:O-antigen/teichoic acid export membrane protein
MSTRHTARHLGSQAAFFLVGNIFTLLVGLPLQIYVARMLGAGNLGIFSLIDGGVGLISGLVAFGLAPTLVKFIPAHLERGEFGCIRKLVGRGALVLLAAGGIAYGSMLLAMPLVMRFWPFLTGFRNEIMVMGLLIPLGLLVFFLQQGLRGFHEIRHMVIGSSFMQLAVKASLALLLLSMGFHLMGYIWAVVASVLCAVAWMLAGLWRRMAVMPKVPDAECKAQQTAWFDYARIQYIGSLLGMGTQYLDRFLLGIFSGAAPVGVLMVVKQLQQLPVIFLQMFLVVAAPMFSAAHTRSDAGQRQHIYHLTTDWVVRLSAPLFIFLAVFTEPLLGLYGQEFAIEGKHALWILLAGQAINLGFGPLGTMLNMSGSEGFLLKLALYEAAVSIAGFLIFVPTFGLSGAAASITISIAFQNIASMWAARSRLSIRWADRRYLAWFIPALLSCGFALMLHHVFALQSAVILVGELGMLYVVFWGVSWLQGINEDDRQLLHQLRERLNG